MYGCDCHIGCLSGEAFRIGSSLGGLVSRIGGGLSGNVVRMGTEKPSQGLSGYVSMVCTSNRDSYLAVSTDVVWLSSDMLGEEFDIYSNVSWRIETEDMDNGGGGQTIMSMLENSTYLYNEYYLKNSV